MRGLVLLINFETRAGGNHPVKPLVYCCLQHFCAFADNTIFSTLLIMMHHGKNATQNLVVFFGNPFW